MRYVVLAAITLLLTAIVSVGQTRTTDTPNPSSSGIRWDEVNERRLVQVGGTLKNGPSAAPSVIAVATFAIYKEAEGGAPLWQETQNVQLDAEGRFNVLLGAVSDGGIPAQVFTADEPRWLSITSTDGT